MKITKTLGIGALAALSAISLPSCGNIDYQGIKPTGLNMVQHGAINGGGSRTRTINNFGADFGNGHSLRYQGMNQMNNGDSDTYFGNHRFVAHDANATFSPAARVLMNREGIKKAQIGAFTQAHLKPLGADYGTTYLVANGDEANVETFTGWNIGKRASIDTVNDFGMTYKGKGSLHTEVQANWAPFEAADNVSIFGRVEADNLDFGNSIKIGGIEARYTW